MIYHIKLINGEEILGTINAEEPNVIYEPLMVEERQDPETGRIFSVLTDYMTFSHENHFVVLPNTLVCKIPVSESAEYYYKVSKIYNRKIVKASQDKELQKVTEAMEAALTDRKSSGSKMIKINSAKSNTSFH